jgi:hypothetical protein
MASAFAMAEIAARYYYSDDTLLRMGPYTFEGGKTLHLTVGIGSGAFRHPNDPPNVMWTIGDRGPNLACDEMKHITGVELGTCGEVRNGRVYPTPPYAPSIGRHLPCHRRDHAEGSQRPPAQRPAQPFEDSND